MEDGGLVCCGDEVDDAVADDAVDGRFVEGDGGDSCFNEGGVVEVCLLGVFVGEVDHVLIRVNKCFFGFGFGALGGERCSPWAYQHQSPCSSLPHS